MSRLEIQSAGGSTTVLIKGVAPLNFRSHVEVLQVFKETMARGEEFVLLSETIEPTDFLNIEIERIAREIGIDTAKPQ